MEKNKFFRYVVYKIIKIEHFFGPLYRRLSYRRFKRLGFSRDFLASFVKDTLNKKDIKVLEVGVEYGGYLDIYYPQLEDVCSEFHLVDMWETEGNDLYFVKRVG